ncbi:siderophore-interacting protein [Streptomyces zaomyceticus]|uniref:siderophore-interacting protein n=1 Tax=Streptomyces zaomyceticus TaxID=68286 RepID=UPI0034463AE4
MRWYAAHSALPEATRPWMRSYTLRTHDPAAGTVDIDFFLHGDGGDPDGEGPATRWARSARPGDAVGMFGPSAVFATPVDPGSGDWTLLYADTCALPALATVVAALPPGQRAVAYVHVPDAAEAEPLSTVGDVTVRPLYGDISAVDASRADPLPDGRPYVRLAGEASVVRALRRPLVEERGVDRRAVHFTGYWRRRLTQDAAPTTEDPTEARERPGGRLSGRGPVGGQGRETGRQAARPARWRGRQAGRPAGRRRRGGHPREPSRTHVLRCGW